MNDHEFSTLRKQLSRRFDPENICFQHFYIQRMNPKLEISLSTFQNDPKIKQKNLTNQQLLKVLTSIEFFEKIKGSNQQKIRINYQNSKKIILITGITTEFVEALLSDFNNQRQKIGKIRKANNFWISVEMNSSENALLFKKLARSQKKICDLSQNSKYKVDRKRVRIVIQDEDFYTILVDAMNEEKARKFNQSFGKECANKVWYQKIQFNRGQTGQLGIPKQQQQEFDDNFSEEQSRTTEGLDGISLKDCIETTDQGIQAQKIEQCINFQYPKSPRSKTDMKVVYSKDHLKKQQNFETESLGNEINSGSQQNSNDAQIGKLKGYSQQHLKPPVDLFQIQKAQNLYTESVENKLKQFQQKQAYNTINKQQPQLSTNRQKLCITQIFPEKNENEKLSQGTTSINEITKIQQVANQKRLNIEHKTKEVQVGSGKGINLFDTFPLKKNDSERQRQFRYQYLHMKKLFHQLQKQRKQTRHVDIHIPSYLVKQCQHQKYHRYFLDGIWRSGRYGSKRNVLKKQLI